MKSRWLKIVSQSVSIKGHSRAPAILITVPRPAPGVAQNQVLSCLRQSRSEGACLPSGGGVFQRAGLLQRRPSSWTPPGGTLLRPGSIARPLQTRRDGAYNDGCPRVSELNLINVEGFFFFYSRLL